VVGVLLSIFGSRTPQAHTTLRNWLNTSSRRRQSGHVIDFMAYPPTRAV